MVTNSPDFIYLGRIRNIEISAFHLVQWQKWAGASPHRSLLFEWKLPAYVSCQFIALSPQGVSFNICTMINAPSPSPTQRRQVWAGLRRWQRMRKLPGVPVWYNYKQSVDYEPLDDKPGCHFKHFFFVFENFLSRGDTEGHSWEEELPAVLALGQGLGECEHPVEPVQSTGMECHPHDLITFSLGIIFPVLSGWKQIP